MERQLTTTIPPEQITKQLDYCHKIAEWNQAQDIPRLAFVDTYGCQQNEADSQKLRGYLQEMGYGFTQVEEEAHIIVLNTCAIREHAEHRVYGNLGALVHTKRRNPQQMICLCGCMAQQPHVAQEIQKSFRHVDLVFGPQALWRFPEMVYTLLTGHGRMIQIEEERGTIAEGIPVVREGGVKAWVSIMYGCNNFCTYCIVPYVRGRERSRQPQDILEEIQGLVAEGYREITLLGQNVNSYGRDLEGGVDFSRLLQEINQIPGDFWIRFMTSHPKDATQRLFETMAQCEKVAPGLHLPFQSGNNRILQAMNRRHTREEYLEKIQQLRRLIPNVVLTSDVIVGFPGETPQEFEDTLRLVEEVEFDALFTFLYSPRVGTPAAELPDPLSREEKMVSFQRLLEVQNQISQAKHRGYVGQTLPCLVYERSQDSRWPLLGRTPGNRLVYLQGEGHWLGQFAAVTITEAGRWSLYGVVQGKHKEG